MVGEANSKHKYHSSLSISAFMLLLCYVNQPLLYFCIGAQIRMLSQRNLLTSASIRKLWKINDWRNDILHRYQRDHLSNPEAQNCHSGDSRKEQCEEETCISGKNQ